MSFPFLPPTTPSIPLKLIDFVIVSVTHIHINT